WNDLALAVDVACERIDFRLEYVADDGETAVRVAVERAIAEREFRLIAGRKQQAPFGVRDGHEDVATQARLYVLPREFFGGGCRINQAEFFDQHFVSV